jgi:type IV pilus assembly protein PilM
MAKKLSSVLGIDIGSRSIKVCEVKTQGREPVVSALGMVPTPEGAVDYAGIHNADAVGLAIKQALQAAGAGAGQAVVTLAGQNQILVRTLEVPRMNDQELRDHMQWEINRNIPFTEPDVYSDYAPLPGQDPAAQNMEVVMAIAPQSAVDTVVSCLKKAGRQAHAIDVEPLSLARVLQTSLGDQLTGKTVCLVDMGAGTCAINIYVGSRLAMPRQIPIGGQMVTQALADTFRIPFADAEELKVSQLEIPETAAEARLAVVNPFEIPGAQTQEFAPYNPFADDAPVVTSGAPAAYNPFTDDPVPVATGDGVPSDATPAPVEETLEMQRFNAVAGVLDELVAEIRRSVEYYRSRGGEVDSILLTGGGSKLRGLDTYVTKSLNIPTGVFDPLGRTTLAARKASPDFVDRHRSEFSVAMGNALHILFD